MTTANADLLPGKQAQLVWFDPGTTTGIVALSIRPKWLSGYGPPSWAGLGKAVTSVWFGQAGREAKIVDEDRGRAVRPPRGRVVNSPGNARSHASAPTDVPGHVAEEIDAIKQCEDVLDLFPAAAWGWESFTAQPGAHSGHEYLSPERVGATLTYVELTYGARRMPFTMPPSMKTTATDERLKEADLYRPGMRHANDAARHAAIFLRECRNDSALRAMAWPRLFRSKAA